MTHEEFDKLVQQIECGLGRDQRRLGRHVQGLAVLGYVGLLSGFIVTTTLASCFIIPGVLWFAEYWPAIFLGLMIFSFGTVGFCRALVVRLPKPEGYELTSKTAPALFSMLDDLRQQLNSAPFHHVLVIPDCNAAVIQRPRLGPFGWFENYLLLGLPLLDNFSAGEVRAIIIHECTHLARSHGKSGQWIYRLRRSWEQIFPSLSRPRVRGEYSWRLVTTKFIGWFWPRFNAHAFVLSRAQEYDADATAARLAGTADAATALVRVALAGKLLEEKFWPDLWRLAAREALPPHDALDRANQFLANGAGDFSATLKQLFLSTTTNADTHPCLSDRLRSIGVQPDAIQEFSARAAAPPESAAAAFLLGDSLTAVREGAQASWRKRVEEQWRNFHSKAGALQDRLGNIELVTSKKAADADALWDKAQVVCQLEGDQAAIALLEQTLAMNPRHVPANFLLGRILLGSGDPKGELFLETAMAEDEHLLPKVAPLLHSYFQRQGSGDRIRALYARLDQFEKSIQASQVERQNVSAADEFLPHELEPEPLAALCAILQSCEDIDSAMLARKRLAYFSKQRLFVLCVRVRTGWHRIPSAKVEQTVIAKLVKTVQLPGRVLIFAPRNYRGIARKLATMGNTIIYQRDH